MSKLSSEHYLYYYRRASGLEYTTLRYSNVYGPRQGPHGEAGVVAVFTQKMLKEEQVVINGNGMQTRDYIFVDDVVDANMAVINNELAGTFNVGTGHETSENQLYRHLLDITASTMKEIHGPEKKGEQVRSVLDWQKLNKAVDWEPRVSLQEGLTRTVAFFNA